MRQVLENVALARPEPSPDEHPAGRGTLGQGPHHAQEQAEAVLYSLLHGPEDHHGIAVGDASPEGFQGSTAFHAGRLVHAASSLTNDENGLSLLASRTSSKIRSLSAW